MSKVLLNSRLTLLFPDLSLIYDENSLQIADDNVLKVATGESDPFAVSAQEKYSWRNTNTKVNETRFTYNANNSHNYPSIIKPILENGYMRYDSNHSRTKFDDFAAFKKSIFKALSNKEIEQSVQDIFKEDASFDSIDMHIDGKSMVTLQVTHVINIDTVKDYLLDLSLFHDTGIFHASRKLNQRETNMQGLIFNLEKDKWQKTNFYIHNFVNSIPFSEDLITLKTSQEGIHPEIELHSNLNSSKLPFRDTDNCERYWLLNTPKQVFLNKFDNELRFDTSIWSLIEQGDHIDLELPDYKINGYDQTYSLFKQDNDYADISSVFKFHLHNRYIDSEKANEDGYTFFDFESTVFDICKTEDPDLRFIKTPFMEKVDLGGFINSHFLNSSTDNVYCNILAQSVETISIPAPDVSRFYIFQLITWSTVILSFIYIVKKSLR